MMNSSWLRALELYGDSDLLWHDVRVFACLHRAYITPRLFLLARPLPLDASDAVINDPLIRHQEDDCEGWFIWAAAGDLGKMLEVDMLGREWIGFARKGRVRWHRARDLLRWSTRLSSTSLFPPSGRTVA